MKKIIIILTLFLLSTSCSKFNIFGFGEIIQIDHSDGNEKITVDFSQEKTKILLTKFAKFEIIT